MARTMQFVLLLLLGIHTQVSRSTATCADDPEVDLCDGPAPNGTGDENSANAAFAKTAVTPAHAFLLALTVWRADAKSSALAFMLLVPSAVGASAASVAANTCGEIKASYKAASCCGQTTQTSNFQIVPSPATRIAGTNVCSGTKPATGYDNQNCNDANGAVQALEQAGANVTSGYQGTFVTTAVPITDPYWKAGLCPVNVHWHLGAEHLSVGQYDTAGTGPASSGGHRLLSASARQGHRCHHFVSSGSKFTTAYHWKHCSGMHVGETYEVHWPHSKGGACSTPNQYQTPFYDGVFCISANLAPTTQAAIGVQSQVFTIVNDEAYYYPDLMRGMIVQGAYGSDIAKYTGSTTGTSRSNTVCSKYSPITWQVDRKCHLISASSFDKMCADMMQQRDDMSDDLHAHGSRVTVSDTLAANNHVRL